MSWHSKLFTSKPQKPLIIGVAEDEWHYCIAYFEANQPIVNFYPKSTALEEHLTVLPLYLIENKQIVRPLPYHYIWRKYLIQPLIKTQDAIFRQVVQTIKQELPIAIEEVYFDYQATMIPEQNLTQLIIYALRKRFAEPLLLTTDTILDCELHCWQRAVAYLSKKQTKNTQIYAFKGKFVEFKLNELSIQNECDKQYIGIEDLNLPENIISQELYLLALGAALWQEKENKYEKEH